MSWWEYEENEAKLKNEEMTVASIRGITDDSVQGFTLENPLQTHILKLPIAMKSHYKIRLRLLCNFNQEHSLGASFRPKLNPECQIKILEENLIFLNNKSSTNVLKNVTPVNDLANTYFQNKHKSANSELGLNELVKWKDETFLNLKTEHAINKNLKTNAINKNLLNSVPLPEVSTDEIAELPSCMATKDRFDDNCEENGKSSDLIKESWYDIDCCTDVHKVTSPETRAETNHDSDNHFEFTVEQEKIVSFVCSPSPPRKERVHSNYTSVLDKCLDTDLEHESDNQSEHTLPKSNSPPEHFSSVSCKSNVHEEGYRYNFMSSKKPNKTNSLHEKPMWHITPAQSRKDNSLGYYCPTNKILAKTNIPDKVDQMTGSGGQDKLQNSINQDTILFRETSLRGCYNLENLLKVITPQLPSVEEEVSRVREAIFSAIRPQKSSDDFISDSVLSILDICKSWIKLNSHFEKKEFEVSLETHGVNTSILHEFSQWQRVSRTFIDTMINSLNKIARAQHTGPCNQHHSTTTIFSPPSKLHCNCGRDSQPTVPLKGSDPCTTSLQKSITFSNNTVVSKQWKQRRCHDQSKKNQTTRTKKLCKTKFTVGGLYDGFQMPTGPSCSSKPMGGQGDSASVFCSSKSYPPLSNTNCLPQICSSLFRSNESKFSLDPTNSNKNQLLQNSKQNLIDRSEKKFVYPLNECNEFSSNPNPLMDMPINQSYQIPMQFPPVHNNQFGLTAQGHVQTGFSQCLLKPNPIHCFDNDVSESFVKTNYIKPGCYNPPQKPSHFQKVVNNSVPIEDVPLVGIPFLYSNSQAQDLPKALKLTSASEESNEKSFTKTSDDMWKSALIMAESFRDSLMATRSDSSPNLKISETVSFKSHFLLSDEVSQKSSSNDLKMKNDNDEIDSLNRPNLELSFMDANLKTSDWLINSFYKTALGNECEAVDQHTASGITRTEQDVGEDKNKKDKNFNCDQLAKNARVCPSEHITKVANSHYMNNDHVYPPKNKLLQEIRQSNQTLSNQKKAKKSKKFRDDFITTYDHRPEMLYRKPKSIFKRAVNKHVSCKLEDILNCIWKTEVSSLIGDKPKTDKDTTRLEMKVRSPLYLQAMRCKLSNHSYDTLEQALNDFHQYFIDIRARNKGDKQCLEAVKALEQIFLNSVEEQFGLMYQPTPQYFGPIGMSPTFKPRKPKKNTRRF